ncbi:hypothetical protein QVZ41_02055 [Wenyingzhuangia sp. chi5]|uniref:Antibiotic acetyltransferase n=1 Tax=Wenyingzhuangia gilva TaxID=3057677 RepID=A0ABT8VNT6_9FLAO|nr:hypothetical protein [Wenyingzhuangia sp. chi5]MDO3693631.1 hypothetical protein [Wenyingzhuangia sp. chi5]
MNKLYKNSRFNGQLGYGSYIQCDSDIIGSFVKVNLVKHPFEVPYVSTSPSFVSLRKQNGSTYVDKQYFEEIRYADSNNKHVVFIGHDCWIGQGFFIVGGVTIGNGAMVLTHGVVTKDVPLYAIVGGGPAKVLKYRYDEETIKFLLEFEWWNKDEEWLKQNIHKMYNIELLKEERIYECI